MTARVIACFVERIAYILFDLCVFQSLCYSTFYWSFSHVRAMHNFLFKFKDSAPIMGELAFGVLVVSS